MQPEIQWLSSSAGESALKRIFYLERHLFSQQIENNFVAKEKKTISNFNKVNKELIEEICAVMK